MWSRRLLLRCWPRRLLVAGAAGAVGGIHSLPAVSHTEASPPTQRGYSVPSPQIQEAVLGGVRKPVVSIQPGQRREVALLLDPEPRLKPLEEVAEKEIRLAGLHALPARHARSQRSFYAGLRLLDLASLEERTIPLPEAARVQDVSWAPDGAQVAFTLTGPNGMYLWLLDVETGVARALECCPRLNGIAASPFCWAGSRTLVAKALPEGAWEGRSRRCEHRAQMQPHIEEATTGRAAPTKPYRDLLRSEDDEEDFEMLAASQLIHITLDETGGDKARSIGEPGVYLSSSPSPNGRFLRVRRVRRPFPYTVPYGGFPNETSVWEISEDGERINPEP